MPTPRCVTGSAFSATTPTTDMTAPIPRPAVATKIAACSRAVAGVICVSRKMPAAMRSVPLLTLPDPPTALFVGSDEQCLGVYRALHDHGLPIPQAMSVVGFDDLPYAASLTPALTTVSQPLR